MRPQLWTSPRTWKLYYLLSLVNCYIYKKVSSLNGLSTVRFYLHLDKTILRYLRLTQENKNHDDVKNKIPIKGEILHETHILSIPRLCRIYCENLIFFSWIVPLKRIWNLCSGMCQYYYKSKSKSQVHWYNHFPSFLRLDRVAH